MQRNFISFPNERQPWVSVVKEDLIFFWMEDHLQKYDATKKQKTKAIKTMVLSTLF
jgi:hypothetical protein